jgi:hypothetical protein
VNKQFHIDNGDRLDEARDVFFYADFKKRSALSLAENELKKLGYEVWPTFRIFRKHSLVVRAFSAITDVAVRELLTEVVTAIEVTGGVFDSWNPDFLD